MTADILLGLVGGSVLTILILKYKILPEGVANFIEDNSGKTFTEQINGKTYEVEIREKR